MVVYMERGNALAGKRIFAQARRIEIPLQKKEVGAGQDKLLKYTTLRGSAFCIIEEPMRGVSGSDYSFNQ